MHWALDRRDWPVSRHSAISARAMRPKRHPAVSPRSPRRATDAAPRWRRAGANRTLPICDFLAEAGTGRITSYRAKFIESVSLAVALEV